MFIYYATPYNIYLSHEPHLHDEAAAADYFQRCRMPFTSKAAARRRRYLLNSWMRTDIDILSRDNKAAELRH